MTEIEKEELYREYYGKIVAYIRSKTGNGTLAEDLASDVFFKVYEKLDSFDSTKASFSTWIYTIARNRLTDYYRTRHVQEEIPETLADDSSVEEDVCNADMLDSLADALRRLDVRERDIIVLHYYSGMTLKDVAARMGISYAYVKILRNKALVTLKKYLGDGSLF